jgi:integral membrane protein (TIGR01906 family)
MEKKFFTIFAIIALISFCFLMMLNNISFYENNIGEKAIEEYGKEKSLEINKEVVDYILSSENNMNQLSSDFTENEKYHLRDVKMLVIILQALFFISSISLIFLIINFESKNIEYSKQIKKSGIYSGLIIIILIVLSLNFSLFFEYFHKVLFPQGNYSFASSSLLIKLYPSIFFENFAKQYFIISLIASILTMLSSYYLSFLKKPKKAV